MSHFNDRPGTKLAIAAAITVVVVAGMIADKGSLAVASLAAQHYSVEMISLFVGLLVVGIVFSWALFSGFSIARSIHGTKDLVFHRGDSSKTVHNPCVCCPDESADSAHSTKATWDNLLRVEQMEPEQKEVQSRGSSKLADQFQAAVGTLIGMGLREPSAHTFPNTAESTQSLAGVAAGHSEASPPARPVGVNEIAGPAQGVSNIAREVVTQTGGRVDNALKSILAIAERINTPALNAVIAGVRAGEAGKGFAVVARELTVLAAQTAKVFEQLGVQIDNRQATTHDPSSPSRTSRPASGEPEKAHRRSQPRWKSRTRDAGDRSQRPTWRPRRRRTGLT